MATLLRVDPLGGCFASPASSVLVGGVLKSGSVTALGVDDTTYYQVNPKTTTAYQPPQRPGRRRSRWPRQPASQPPATTTSGSTTKSCRSPVDRAPPPGPWLRGQLGTSAATHATNAVVSALANDWYVTFTGVPAGGQNLKVTYKGKNCSNTIRFRLYRPHHQPASADDQDLQLDNLRRGRLLDGDLQRLGDSASTSIHRSRLDRCEHNLDPSWLRCSLHRHRRVPGSGARARSTLSAGLPRTRPPSRPGPTS